MKLIPAELETMEIELLLEAILRRRGYDFRDYAQASLRRRLHHRLAVVGANKLSELIPKVLHDEAFFDELLRDLSITVTEMFRDPHFFRALRATVMPLLRTYPYIKIWHAGCATGEEVYSLAIMLHEAGLLERSQIYATDFNNRSLEIAQRGLFALQDVEKYSKNYQEFGGSQSFADYYRTQYESVKFHDFLSEKIVFANHNLVTDGVFGEMHLILCRNVLIYFGRNLQGRVLTLFSNSLIHRGVLCLGDKESVAFTTAEENFDILDKSAKIFRLRSPAPNLPRDENEIMGEANSAGSIP